MVSHAKEKLHALMLSLFSDRSYGSYGALWICRVGSPMSVGLSPYHPPTFRVVCFSYFHLFRLKIPPRRPHLHSSHGERVLSTRICFIEIKIQTHITKKRGGGKREEKYQDGEAHGLVEVIHLLRGRFV
eukprot:3644587-Rhodomonas_salina.1